VSFNYPTETIKEGEIEAVVPKLAAFKEKPSDYAPSKAPVFYNPIMELNRDLAVLALQTYQKIINKPVFVSEPLTGCGIRGIRFAAEIKGVKKVDVNDIKPEAAKITEYNVKLNEFISKIEVNNEDANLFLCKHSAPRNRFDYIDIDPFGPPIRYIDSALRSIRNRGMLALTATDMAPLCGVHPRACLRKYGGTPLRTEYCHELAVRILSGCLTMMAAKHDIGIEVVFSYSKDHYVRTYNIIKYGAKSADKSVNKMGFILHCFSCFHRERTMGMITPNKQFCPHCDSKFSIAGPLWLGSIADKEFTSLMRKDLHTRNLTQHKKIYRLLSLVKNEAEAPITYFVVDKICDKINSTIPSQQKIIKKLKEDGLQAVLTHFNSRGIKTDGSAEKIKEIITEVAP
jgi:tRNA (guanine26-N2/guanine27-N2)-dimethyltransferase